MFPEAFSSLICKDSIIRPTFYEGVLVWVMAYYQKFQTMNTVSFERPPDTRLLLRKKLGFGSDDSALDNLIKQSKLFVYFNEIEEDFKQIYACKSKPCDKEYLARKQYLTGTVANISHTKYSSLNFSSIANMPGNRKKLQNKIPEIASFFLIHFNHSDRIFGGEPEKLLGYYRGTLA